MGLFKKICSGFFGALAGMVTGIFAGLIPGYYYMLKPTSDSVYPANIIQLFAFVAYVALLPFFIVYQMFRGMACGMLNGFMAGLTYPKTVDEEFKLAEVNKVLVERAEEITANHNNLLTKDEIKKLNELMGNDGAIVNAFDKGLKEYNDYVQGLKSLILARGKNTESVSASNNKQSEVLVGLSVVYQGEAKTCFIRQDELLARMKYCYDKGIRMSIRLPGGMAYIEDITSVRDVLPSAQSSFIARVRKLLTANRQMNALLGAGNRNGMVRGVANNINVNDQRASSMDDHSYANEQRKISPVQPINEPRAPQNQPSPSELSSTEYQFVLA